MVGDWPELDENMEDRDGCTQSSICSPGLPYGAERFQEQPHVCHLCQVQDSQEEIWMRARSLSVIHVKTKCPFKYSPGLEKVW